MGLPGLVGSRACPGCFCSAGGEFGPYGGLLPGQGPSAAHDLRIYGYQTKCVQILVVIIKTLFLPIENKEEFKGFKVGGLDPVSTNLG